MRPRFRSPSGPRDSRAGRPLELVRVRGAQRNAGDEGRDVKGRSRRRGGRGRGKAPRLAPALAARPTLWGWLKDLFVPKRGESATEREVSLSEQEARTLAAFGKHYGITFANPELLKLALTHRSYLSVTGQGPRESNERLEFLGDSVLGLVTSEFLYRANPNEHEGQLTKTKSLLVSKAILSRRALAMGLGRFVLMSHSEVESGGRQRLSILADAFESVLGAIYLDQGFEAARQFIIRWLLAESREIAADKRHTNYKSHLQEYVQSTFRTHPLYRIRSEMGPDHSKMFNVEVLVGRKTLGTGRGRNKKEAEQAAARDALEKVENRNQEQTAREATSEGGALPPTPVARPSAARGAATAERERRGAREESEAEPEERPRRGREPAAREPMAPRIAPAAMLEHEPEIEEGEESESEARAGRRRGRRGGRGRRRPEGVGAEAVPREIAARPAAPAPPAETAPSPEAARGRSLARPRAGHESVVIGSAPLIEPSPAARRGRPARIDDDLEEIGRPEGPLDDGSEEISAPWKPLASRPAAEPVRERQEREREPRREEREPRREEARVVEREEPVIEEEPWSPPSEARREPPAEPAGRPEEGAEGSRFGRRPGRSRRGR